MIRTAFMAVLIALAFGMGWLASQQFMPLHGTADSSGQDKESADTEPLYWVAPMDADYRRDKPGKSPMGMDLVPVYEEEDSDRDDGGVQINPAVRANLGVSPMIGGMITTLVLALLLIPVIFYLWQRARLKKLARS